MSRIGRRLLAFAIAASLAFLACDAALAQAVQSAGALFRSLDGLSNNVAHPRWGVVTVDLLRGPSGSHYADGRSAPSGQKRPLARAISNAIFRQQGSLPNRSGLSDYIWTWGQFVDHDLSLSIATYGNVPIGVPTSDPEFDPAGTGTQKILFRRTFFNPMTGVTGPREHLNLVSSYIDASMVYGTDPVRSRWLRTLSGGEMKVTATAVGDLMPYNDGRRLNAGNPEQVNYSKELFVAGDIRANEQPTLAAIHTVFVREHNFQARRIRQEHAEWRDEQIYQQARRIVIAEIQRITYSEFLPALLGADDLGPDPGYDLTANATVSLVFSTAAFRLGHTLLSPNLLRLREDGTPAGPPLSLRDTFFEPTPPILAAEGLDPLLRGLAAQPAQELDDKVIDDVRSFLFGKPGQGGLDLISLNIQRGRDVGLPDFNTVRADFGLPRKAAFSDITRDTAKAETLSRLYSGDIGDIDLFVGLLVEDRVPDRLVGQTLRAALVDQFSRSRAGDRFWYERTLDAADLERVKSTRLSDILLRTTSIKALQRNVFFVR
jgi:hypothetical protein